MSSWIFLSKHGQDQYINMFAAGSKGTVTNTDHFDYYTSSDPIVLRGILKHKIMQQCWKDSRTFYYMDTGYLGNNKNPLNPQGWKVWHRIVPNNLQHTEILPRPGDRLEKLKINIHPRRHGRKIIVAAPDDKPCKFYNINKEDWIKNTVNTVKQYTDRPVIIRERAPNRIDRIESDPLHKVLADDVHALITFNSVAATESILAGVPAFVLAPNAAGPVANQDLRCIDSPDYPDPDKLHAWASHLAYCQYHVSELKDGTAYRMLNEH